MIQRHRLPYRTRSNSWQPARLRAVDHAVIMAGLIIIAFVRGFDYLIGNDNWGAKDFMIAAAPEWVWGGIGFVLGATILTLGVTTKRHLLVYVGHGWLMAAYGLNALALMLSSGPTYALPIIAMASAVLVTTAYVAHSIIEKGKGCLAFLLIAAVATFGATALALSDTFDGIRGGDAVGFVAMLHLLQMVRTGGRPLRLSSATYSEEVVNSGGGDE